MIIAVAVACTDHGPPAVAVVRVEPAQATLHVSQSTVFTASLSDASGASLTSRTVVWTSSNATVTSVSSSGTVIALAPGASVITAASGGKSASAAVTVIAPVATVQLSVSAFNLETDSATNIVVLALDANGNALVGRPIAWSSSSPTIASVTQSGRVTGLLPGTAAISATIEGRVGISQVTVLSRGVRQSTNVLDSTRTKLVVDSARQAAGIYTFDLLGGTGATPMAVGQVLVGTQGGGFLRRVTSVQATSNRVTVATVQASLTDAVRDGSFRGTSRLSLPGALITSSFNQPPVQGEVVWGQRSISTASGPVVVRNGEIELDDVEFYDNGAGTVLRFTDGRIKFEPDFLFALALSGSRVDRLEVSATGNLAFDGDYVLQFAAANAGVSREIPLFTVSQPFYTYVGLFPFGVPVIGVVSLAFKGTARLAASARATVRTGFRSNGSVTVGGRYSRTALSSWEFLRASGAAFVPVPISSDASIGVSAEAGLKAELRLTLYGVLGPYMYVQATAAASRTVDFLAQVMRDRCVARIDAGVGFDVSILSFDALVSFGDDRNLLTAPFCNVDTPLALTTTLSGRVYDAITNVNLSAASVTVTRFGAPIATVLTSSQGTYSALVPDNSTYSITASASGYVSASIISQTVNGPTTALPIPLVRTSNSRGGISGRLLNARNNAAIAGATAELREGINATTGNAFRTTTTNATGNYTFADLSAGTYSVLGKATGFVDGSRTGIAVGGTTVSGQDLILSPVGTASAIRIVLTWGATPFDLDSHLTGPVVGSSSRFHVYYGDQGSCNGSPFACLDVDDVTSYGPETITITQLFNGTYRYSVQNFSAVDHGSTSDATLSASNARVDVYVNNVLRASFAVPQQSGTLWTVFTMDQNGTITPINSVSGTPPGTGAVRGMVDGANTDADIVGAALSPKRPPTSH